VATIVTPSLGHAVWTQTGTGTSPGYDAIDVRRGFDSPETGEGVETYGTYRVSQRGAGANMSVDISMDGFAYVRGDAVAHQAPYRIAPHSATINEAIATADATNPRVDQVVLRVFDTTHDASGSNNAQVQVLAGTPTAGATLDNRNGVAALPSSAILLADILVAATDTAISDAEIRDRRPFVCGVPPLLTDVDMAALIPQGVGMTTVSVNANADLAQGAVLCYLPRRIVGATRIRWKYEQNSVTAMTGNYVFGIYDSSGRKVIDTGSVAFTGAASSVQQRSETIAATTFEPGTYYVLFGADYTNAGAYSTHGTRWVQATVNYPNIALYSATGGVTAPTTVLGFVDQSGIVSADIMVPHVALSVG